MTPVGERCKPGGLPGIDFKAVRLQLQVADNLRPQQAAEIGGSRDSISRPDLLGDTGPSDDLAPLQHQYAPAGLRQIASGNQPIMSCAYYNCIELRHSDMPPENDFTIITARERAV